MGTTARTSLAALIGVALVMAVVTLALAASMSDAQLVAARQAAMKQNGMVLKGAKNLTGQAAIDAATTVLKNFTNFPAQFRKGSITPDSKATDKIWENWGDFTSRMADEKARAQAMLAAAKAGDKAAYTAAISALTKVCSDCHLTYGRVF